MDAERAFDLVLGVALIGLAIYLRRKRPDASAAKTPSGPSKIERYLESRRLAFVLGLTLYVLPSPIYVAAVKTIADAQLSTSSELLSLAATVAVMLWLIEVPMLMLLAVPDRASGAARARQPVVHRTRATAGSDRLSRGRRLPDHQGPRRPDQLKSRPGPRTHCTPRRATALHATAAQRSAD